MKELLKALNEIHELLKQISNITDNQTTILLQSRDNKNSEESPMSMLEGMMEYKEALIEQLSALEDYFEKVYGQNKEAVKISPEIDEIKGKVKEILKLKQAIMDGEQNNAALLKSLISTENKVTEIPRSAKDVTAAYKMQQKIR